MRSLHLLPLAALALTLGACGGTSNRGMESVHQPVVTRTDYVYDVANNFGPQDMPRIRAWMDSIKVGYGDRVSVDDPSDNPANRASIAAAAVHYGLILQGTAPVTQGNVSPGMFRVVVSRSKAEVPGCPDWSRSSTGNFNTDAPSNFGCASNASLAAMVANPEDLVTTRRGGNASGTTTRGDSIRKSKAGN